MYIQYNTFDFDETGDLDNVQMYSIMMSSQRESKSLRNLWIRHKHSIKL